jgi:hypothetical protein
MGLEVTTFIAGLNNVWPLGPTDSATQGDDHLRLIKSVLKSTFPGASGNGFASQITATEAEINRLAGVTSPLQTQLNALQASITAQAAQITALQASQAEFVGSASANGYQKFPGGLIFQWGNATVPANNVPLVVTLPIAFPTLYYQSVCTPLGSASASAMGSDGNLTTITLYNSYAAPQNCRWLAVGH